MDDVKRVVMDDIKRVERWQPPAWFQITGLVAAIAAVVVTVYFSARSEQRKALTVRYFGERALLSREGRTSSGLAVTLGGERLQAPWLFSGRVENTGNQPIETRDIEDPLHLEFGRGRVVAAEKVETSPQFMPAATVTHEGNIVTLKHALLNPGDWISFDIIFDGQPNLPKASLRISGVSHPDQVISSLGEKHSYPTVLPMPPPILYLTLVLGSLAALGTIGAGCGLAISAVRDHFGSRPPASQGRPRVRLDEELELLVGGLQPQSPEAQLVTGKLGLEPTLQLIDDPDRLATMITQGLTKNLLDALGLDSDRAARLICSELKSQLKRSLSRWLYSRLPSPADGYAQSGLMNMDVTTTSAADIAARATQLAEMSNGPSYEVHQPLDKGQLVGGIIALLVGLSVAVVLGGTWRTLLGV